MPADCTWNRRSFPWTGRAGTNTEQVDVDRRTAGRRIMQNGIHSNTRVQMLGPDEASASDQRERLLGITESTSLATSSTSIGTKSRFGWVAKWFCASRTTHVTRSASILGNLTQSRWVTRSIAPSSGEVIRRTVPD